MLYSSAAHHSSMRRCCAPGNRRLTGCAAVWHVHAPPPAAYIFPAHGHRRQLRPLAAAAAAAVICAHALARVTGAQRSPAVWSESTGAASWLVTAPFFCDPVPSSKRGPGLSKLARNIRKVTTFRPYPRCGSAAGVYTHMLTRHAAYPAAPASKAVTAGRPRLVCLGLLNAPTLHAARQAWPCAVAPGIRKVRGLAAPHGAAACVPLSSARLLQPGHGGGVNTATLRRPCMAADRAPPAPAGFAAQRWGLLVGRARAPSQAAAAHRIPRVRCSSQVRPPRQGIQPRCEPDK